MRSGAHVDPLTRHSPALRSTGRINLKACLRARFVPPHFRKDLMLKLQQFHQGVLSVDDYFKQLDTPLIRVNMDESEEAKIARFVSGLRRDIQDVVEL